MNESSIFKSVSVLGNSVFVRQKDGIVKINVDDLIYIKSNQNMVILQSNNNRFIINSSLRQVEAMFSKKGFYRINRSHLVKINKIDIIGNTFIMITGLKIAIGAGYKRPFLNILSIYKS